MQNPTTKFDIIKSSFSKINDVDFDNIIFGSVFTDHMLICDYVDGQWLTPTIKPYEPFMIDPSARVFHYGQAIFEGMKAYKDDNNDVWLFRPDQNFNRFNKSAVRLAMPEVPSEIFIDGLKILIDLDREWVKNCVGNSLYIRPFMIATSQGVLAQPSTQFRFMIILSPAKTYFSGEVKVTIADHYSRAANGGIGYAKAAGNYAGGFYPTKLANSRGYQQILWTDDATHTKLEEAGTMNVFVKINETLYTAPVSERILDGVTRKSLIELAKREGIEVVEQSVLVDELIKASKDGSLKEMFGAGTAAIVSPIVGFEYKGDYYELPKIEKPVALSLKEKLNNIQYKISEDTLGWTVKV